MKRGRPSTHHKESHSSPDCLGKDADRVRQHHRHRLPLTEHTKLLSSTSHSQLKPSCFSPKKVQALESKDPPLSLFTAFPSHKLTWCYNCEEVHTAYTTVKGNGIVQPNGTAAQETALHAFLYIHNQANKLQKKSRTFFAGHQKIY